MASAGFHHVNVPAFDQPVHFNNVLWIALHMCHHLCHLLHSIKLLVLLAQRVELPRNRPLLRANRHGDDNRAEAKAWAAARAKLATYQDG